MNLVVYTAIFGDFDKLQKPKVINRKTKYICFSDRNFDCPPWDVIVVKPTYKDPRRENRKYKILSHRYFPDYQYSIYLDGNLTINCDLIRYLKKWLKKNDIAVKKHPLRNCIYNEAQVCLKDMLDDKKLILKQIKKYRKELYPKNNGLTFNNFIIREHTDKIKKFNEMWWKEVKKFSRRDQLSFCYVIYKLRMKYAIIPIKEYKICIQKNVHLKSGKYYYSNANERLLSFITKILLILLIVRFSSKKQTYRRLRNYLLYDNFKKVHKLKLPKIIKYFIKFIY